MNDSPDDESGLRNLERIAAAHEQVARELEGTRPDLVGTVLSHYRILGRLGSGSMGDVYRARDERLHLDRVVALKVLHRDGAPEDALRQILIREARIACSFTHPNIATIFEVGETDGQVFIAMEYVEGSTLLDAIRRRPLSSDTVVRYGIQIASALDAAHDAGIIHRDLKSNNVVITPAGLVKVLDFGIAVRTRAGAPDTESADVYGPAGGTAGTLPYMSPECLRGEPPDRRCDIWALGVTLYEALAGKRPFAADSRIELERAIQEDEPAPLPARVPLQLRRVVERCLRKGPGERFQRAGEVRAALEAIRDGQKPVRRRVVTAAGLVALIALAVALFYRMGPPSRPDRGGTEGRSLVVLPARNASGIQAQQFLADGLTDEIINSLMRLASVRVLSRQSSYAIAREKEPLPALARRHSLDLVLESSIVQIGERVRVTAQLVEAKSDRQIWARSYERPVAETLMLDREIVRGVAECLNLPLSSSELAGLGRAPPVDRSAYREYVLGRNFALERDYRRALSCYERAARLDSAFAPAYAGLAECYIEMLYYRDAPPEVTLARAGAAAQEALRIDSTQASAHLALAYVHGIQWDWKNASVQLASALASEPGSPEVWYGWSFYHGVLGHTREEVDAMERSVAGDPLSLRYANELGLAYLNAGRTRDAEAQFAKVMQSGEASESRRARSYWARCLAIGGRAPQAIDTLQAMGRQEPAPYLREELAYALARAGRDAEARRLVAELRASGRGAVSPLAIAAAEVALKMPDAAFATLQEACDSHDSRILWVRVDKRFDPIRKDPRFAQLLERMAPSAVL